MPDLTADSLRTKKAAVNEIADTPGYNCGPTGMSGTYGWYDETGLAIYRDIYTQGMTNVVNTSISKYSAGDFNGFNLNSYIRGGTHAPADEGFSGFRNYLTVGTDPYEATIATGGPQATALTMSWAVTRSAGVGQPLLDLSTATSFNVTAVSVVTGNQAVDGNYALLTTDGTFTPSATVTLTTLNTATLDPQNTGSVQALTFRVKKPLLAGDLIQLGGLLPEAIRVIIANPVATDGTQTITANVRWQHWPGTLGMVNGPAASWLEQTNFTQNGLRYVSYVLGAVDAHTLAVFNLVPGGMDFGYLFTGPATLYAGAVITDVRKPDGSETDGYHLKLADNNGLWTPPARVESTNAFTAWWKGYAAEVINNNPFSSGVWFNLEGMGSAFGGVSGTGAVFHIKNNEPASSYTFAGGRYNLVPTFQLQGELGTLFDLDRTPHGPLFLLPAENVCVVALKNHNASFTFDATNQEQGQWNLNSTRVNVPRAHFDQFTGVALDNTTIQGTDGAGSPSLTVLQPLNNGWGTRTTAIHSTGDVVIDGKLVLNGQVVTPTPGIQGIQGVPGPKGDPGTQGLQGVPGPKGDPGPAAVVSGFTGTIKFGGITLTVKNGLIQ